MEQHKSVYLCAQALLEDAQNKGLITLVFSENDLHALEEQLEQDQEQVVIPISAISILDLDGWVDFLHDVINKSECESELIFVKTLFKVFEQVQKQEQKKEIIEEKKETKDTMKQQISQENITDLKIALESSNDVLEFLKQI